MPITGFKRVAVFCIIKSGDLYLLLQRAKAPNIGKFVPVGGKVEPYESPKEAVIRETYEETGIHLENIQFCGVLTETSPIDYNWVSFIYQTEIDFIDAPDCDEGVLFWKHKDEFNSLDMPPTDHFINTFISKNTNFVFSAHYNDQLHLINLIDEISGDILV